MALQHHSSAEQTIEKLRAEVSRLREERDLSRAKHDALLRQIYGKRAERVTEDGFGPLFDGVDQPEIEPVPPPHVDEAPDDEEIADPSQAKKPRKRGAPRLPKDLPRVVQDIKPSDEESRCSCCGELREVIGFEETEKLEFQPASCFICVIRRPKLVCKAHEEAGVTTPDLPPQVVHKGLAGASMLAQVVTAKFRDHLPLYRQSRILQRHGVEIPESTLGDWIAQSHEALAPVVASIKESVLSSGYVSTDDTGVTLLGKGNSKNSQRAHFWSYLGEQCGDVVFDFTPGRGGEGPKRMLAGYEGFLQADAYSVYDALFRSGKIIEVGCLAHARRKFFDAKDVAAKEAMPALHAIQALYRVERACKAEELTPDQRLERRIAQSRDTFARLSEWLAELRSRVLPKSPIGKAVNYFCNHTEALGRFLQDGRLEIDNNRCERTMRQVAVGRKNWLFAGSEAGGRRAATLYSLTVSCWELQIDPFVYLTDVLDRLSTTPSSQVASLTPRGWAAAREG